MKTNKYIFISSFDIHILCDIALAQELDSIRKKNYKAVR